MVTAPLLRANAVKLASLVKEMLVSPAVKAALNSHKLRYWPPWTGPPVSPEMPLSALLVSELVDTSWDSSWLVSWPVPSVASAAVGSRPKISTSDRKLANNRFFICLFLLMICFLPYGTKCPIGAPVPAPPPSAGTAPRGLAVSSRRRRGSRCLHRCGCRPPPATHGRGHTATIFAACCRRSRFVGQRFVF